MALANPKSSAVNDYKNVPYCYKGYSRSLGLDVSDRLSLSTSLEWNMFRDDVDDTLGGDEDDDEDLAGLCRLV